jgi:hypothetical protein
MEPDVVLLRGYGYFGKKILVRQQSNGEQKQVALSMAIHDYDAKTTTINDGNP